MVSFRNSISIASVKYLIALLESIITNLTERPIRETLIYKTKALTYRKNITHTWHRDVHLFLKVMRVSVSWKYGRQEKLKRPRSKFLLDYCRNSRCLWIIVLDSRRSLVCPEVDEDQTKMK